MIRACLLIVKLMKLYNSYSSQIENFNPIDPKNVKMYVCGITPYDITHLGHAFVYVTFDALKRYLEFKNNKVIYTQNVTDIDDDVLKHAKRDNKGWKELGNFWTDKFLNDMKSLNVLMPDHFIRATEAMDEIIEMISVLVNKSFTYEKNGNVYFEIAKFPDYGKLSKYSKEQMLVLLKERGGDPKDPNKKAPLDFLLWQQSKKDEPFWDSPWPSPQRLSAANAGGGKGRPGWHIECSAMIKKTLGEQIDIHGGGFDLIYPHHESELAQSESYSGKSSFVKFWMHIAMVSYQGEKMSKSLGNLVLVSDLLKKYSANAIRLMLLTNHYRKPWEYTDDLMIQAQELMTEIEKNLKDTEADSSNLKELIKDLEDDFNTPETLRKLIDASIKSPEISKAGFELLGFNLN